MKFPFLITLILALCIGGIQAQESVNSAGSDFSGNGGSVSFSIGQVFYETQVGSTGSVAQGVQQAYEISTINDIGVPEIVLAISVYPNPTTDILHLSVGNHNLSGLGLELFDVSGKLLFKQSILEPMTSIDMGLFPTATYYLNIIDRNNLIKTFKIIKT